MQPIKNRIDLRTLPIRPPLPSPSKNHIILSRPIQLRTLPIRPPGRLHQHTPRHLTTITWKQFRVGAERLRRQRLAVVVAEDVVTGYLKVTKTLDPLGGEKGMSFLVFGGVFVVVEEDVLAEVGAFK